MPRRAPLAFIFGRAGKPPGQGIAVEAPEPGEKRRVGFMSGSMWAPDDFDRMGSEEIATMFEGEA